MSFGLPKPALNSSIEKIIWNLRISKQASFGWTPFEKHFNRTANTRWKNLIYFNDHLNKGKSIFSSRRASNWGMHDGVDDGYLDEEKNNPSDPEDNIPLAQTILSPTKPESHKQPRGSDTKKKLVAGGKLYRTAINRKTGKTYFNLINKDIIDFPDHKITLDNGHILRKSDLAIKVKLLPGPKNIMVNQPPIVHKSHSHSSLAGNRKLSPSKKTLVTATAQPRQSTSGAGGLTQSWDTPTGGETTQDLIQISSGSSSSLNLNS